MNYHKILVENPTNQNAKDMISKIHEDAEK
jgi:hypothetical protein